MIYHELVPVFPVDNLLSVSTILSEYFAINPFHKLNKLFPQVKHLVFQITIFAA